MIKADRGFGVAHIGVVPSSVRALRDVQLLLDECSAGRGATAATRATPTYRVVTTTNKWGRRTRDRRRQDE